MDLAHSPLPPIHLSSISFQLMLALFAMHSSTTLLVAASLAMQAVLGYPEPSKVLQEREAELLKRSVDSFIATESPIALTDLLCNIGSAGACVPGADSGIVLASPDSTNPDCT